jgi:hypothetical protein
MFPQPTTLTNVTSAYQSPSTSGFMMMDRNTVEWKQHIICLGAFAG